MILVNCSSDESSPQDHENTAPYFISSAVHQVQENNLNSGYVASAMDAENDAISFSLVGGDDVSLFAISANAGALLFNSNPDYENPNDANKDNDYIVTIRVSDGVLFSDLTVTVTITDDPSDNPVNSPPVFTSPVNIEVVENTIDTGYVATASDAENDTLTFSIAKTYSISNTGETILEDLAIFQIDEISGVLSFKQAPDFENPGDINQQNDYVVGIKVSDGINDSFLTLTVSVTDDPADNSNPVFTSAHVVVLDENQTSTLYYATATDPGGGGITFSLSGGEDQTLFNVNANSGELVFKVAPDYENPSDLDLNNDYLVDITATNGNTSVAANITVRVLDVPDESGNAPLQISLPRSGQASCFNSTGTQIDCAGSGQDGDLQAGVVWPANRFDNSLDYRVTLDSLTNLMWVSYHGSPGMPTNSINQYLVSWSDSLDLVAQANAQQFLGYSDWRVANINELMSIHEFENSNGPLWTTNGHCSDARFWASTTPEDLPDQAISVSYGYAQPGITTVFSKLGANAEKCFRMVRGDSNNALAPLAATGQTQCYDNNGNIVTCAGSGQDGAIQAGVVWPLNRFVSAGNGSITDSFTGLVWTTSANLIKIRDPSFDTDVLVDGFVSWQHALDYVTKLNNESYLGFADWRLPNVFELRSLLNAAAPNRQWLFDQGFSDLEHHYWTSTSFPYDPTRAIGVLIGDSINSDQNGDVFLALKSGSASGAYVWPVRGP